MGGHVLDFARSRGYNGTQHKSEGDIRMDFLKLAAQRYSCKAYDGRQVEQDKLSAILEAGRLAPTAKNGQEQRVYVIQSPEGLAKIDKLTPCRYGAPTVLAVAYDKAVVYSYPGGNRNMGAEDADIVANHMMLAAADLGVDSCWLNRFDPEVARVELGLPEHEELILLLDRGYAAPGAGPLPNHTARKSLSDTVRYL